MKFRLKINKGQLFYLTYLYPIMEIQNKLLEQRNTLLVFVLLISKIEKDVFVEGVVVMFSRPFLRRNFPILAVNMLPEPDSKHATPKLLKFSPLEFPGVLESLQKPKGPVHLIPIRHYSSADLNLIFEALLKNYENLSSKVILNIPWRTPGSWVGCNSRCEQLEKEVMKHYKITRSPVE